MGESERESQGDRDWEKKGEKHRKLGERETVEEPSLVCPFILCSSYASRLRVLCTH